MRSPKNFEKIAILKIWQLVSFIGGKTHFGKTVLKKCIFRHEKKFCWPIWLSNCYHSYKMLSVWYLDNILIIFWDHDISKRQHLLPKINNLMTNKAYFLPKWVLTPQKEISCCIFKLAILTKLFGDLMNPIIREYAGKKWNYYWMFQH